MWIIAALSERFKVTVYTRGGFDLEELNRLAGTEVVARSLTIRMANVEDRMPIGAFAAGRFQRSLYRVGDAYDLRVSLSGILPWGRPALHFLSSIDCDPELAAKMWHDGCQPLKVIVSRLVQRIAAGPTRSASGLFVANSQWLKAHCSKACAGTVEVIHPPVATTPSGLPWEHRDETVLVFGRISPEKRVETCIRIVDQARAAGFGGRMVIAGPNGPPDYTRKIRAMAAERDWVTILPGQMGADRDALLGRVRYGLNACLYEAFGISTAEIAGAGAIVLVPQNTGQSEIITDPIQHFSNESEAAERLVALGRDQELRLRLQADALSTSDKFAPARFMISVQKVAQRALALEMETRDPSL
jgi:glycosyltransferase involved in cell wall biosynthesis